MGKVRVGSLTGLKERKIGAPQQGCLGDQLDPGQTAPRYRSVDRHCHLSLNQSDEKGVLTGMLKPPVPASTTGARLLVAVFTGQEFPDSNGDIGIDLVQADPVEIIVTVGLQVLAAADPSVGHDGAAAAWLVSCGCIAVAAGTRPLHSH